MDFWAREMKTSISRGKETYWLANNICINIYTTRPGNVLVKYHGTTVAKNVKSIKKARKIAYNYLAEIAHNSSIGIKELKKVMVTG